MPAKKYRIELTTEEQQELKAPVSKGRTAAYNCAFETSMPTNLASPSICTSSFSVDPSLHDASSIGPGNWPGSTVEERGDPCYWTVYHDPDATGLTRSGPPHMSYCRGPKSGYKMLPRNHPDRIRIAFDDHRLVTNAGLILPATRARHLGLPELVQQRLDLGNAPGRANTGDKMMTLVASALTGGDCIDDAGGWRTGGTARTLGIFLRSFRWGHVRQLDRVSRELLAGHGRPEPDPATRHLPSTSIPPSARPTAWPRRAPATTACPVLDTGATPAPGAITRCWPSPPAPGTC